MRERQLIPEPTDYFSPEEWSMLASPLQPIARVLASMRIEGGWRYKADSRWPLVSLTRRVWPFASERISLALQPDYLENKDTSWVLARTKRNRIAAWFGLRNSSAYEVIACFETPSALRADVVVPQILNALSSNGESAGVAAIRTYGGS